MKHRLWVLAQTGFDGIEPHTEAVLRKITAHAVMQRRPIAPLPWHHAGIGVADEFATAVRKLLQQAFFLGKLVRVQKATRLCGRGHNDMVKRVALLGGIAHKDMLVVLVYRGDGGVV